MTTMTMQPSTWMTLADIARLAEVQRPVVSMWRTRHADFPEPAGARQGHPVFDAAQIGTWLQESGRGNNPDAFADALAFAHADDGVTPEATAALLTLSAMTGEQLLDLGLDEVRALAGRLDPDDRFLRSEIEGLDGDPDGILAYADQLADAAYSPARALDLLVDQRLRHDGSFGRRTAASADLQALVATTVHALADALDLHPLTLVDASRGGTGMLPAAAQGSDDSTTVLLGDHAGTWARLTRRRVRAHGILTQTCETDEGLPVLAGPQLVVLQLPDGPRPAMTDRQILQEVGELSLRMSEQQWAIVVAPASALADRLRDSEAERERDDILRAGRLRLALRLPAGLLPHRGQQRLGMWLLGAAHPDVPPERRWTVVGDLSDVPLDEVVRDEIATDAVAALGDVNVVRGHAFRHARLVSAPNLVAARGDLVTSMPVRSARDHPTPAQTVLEVERLREEAGLPDLQVHPARQSDDSGAATTTLGRAMQRSLVRLLPGHRIRARDIFTADAATLSGVVVIGPEELSGEQQWGRRRVDRLQLHGSYAAAQLTEPGDVVFCMSRRVIARIDRLGGSVVCAPARVLRVRPQTTGHGGLVPEVLAADLARQPVAAKAYRSWTVRLVPDEQRRALTAYADEIARQREDVQRRLEALDALQQTLVDGVAAGVAVLDPVTEDPSTGDNAMTDKGE